MLVARRARQALRVAEATYVPRRSLLEHAAAFSVGWAVLAAVWLPLHYHGLAADEAEAALERGSDGSRFDESGGCFVTRVERADVAGEWGEGEVVERDLTRDAPLWRERARVRAAGLTTAPSWSGRTDAAGRLVIPLRALVPAGGAPPAALEVSTRAGDVVVIVPPSAWAPGDAEDPPVDADALAASTCSRRSPSAWPATSAAARWRPTRPWPAPCPGSCAASARRSA